MFQNFFNSENPVFRFTGRVLDILVLSVMWVVCSLPIVTIGPASAALYYSCVKCLRYKEGGAYRSFLSAFKLNLKPGIGVTVVLLVLAVVLGKVIGDLCGGISFLSWLGLSAQFGLQPCTLDLAILQVTFGLLVNINVAQAILLFVAILVYSHIHIRD